MPETDIGPWRIFVTPSGEWCDECWVDCKDQTDQDFATMGVQERKTDGTCICCGAHVIAGEIVDFPHAFV